MEKQNYNIWKVLYIFALALVFLLSIGLVAKMAYSVGYEDGQQGILEVIKTYYETGNKVTQLPGLETNKYIKEFVYIFVR